MSGDDHAMEVYGRLLAERADEMLLREDAAAHFAEFFGHFGPELVQQLLDDARKRRSERASQGQPEGPVS